MGAQVPALAAAEQGRWIDEAAPDRVEAAAEKTRKDANITKRKV
jgi:hypothetical protein